MPRETPTPSAANKRRRIEAANATLRKPFRSPLVSRQQQGTSGVGGGTDAQGSPAVNRTSHAGKPLLLGECGAGDGGGGGTSVGRASVAGVKRKLAATTTTTTTKSFSPTAPASSRGDGAAEGGGGEGGDLLARLHAAQKHLATDLRGAEARLEIVRQARGIEEATSTVVAGD